MGTETNASRSAMRRVISGSRGYPNPEYVDRYVSWRRGDIIVVGKSPRGVDRWAEEAALARGIVVEPHPAKWDGPWGKLAGKVRNVEMVEAGESLTAFWDGWSNGTAHAIAMAAAAGKLGRVVLPDDLTVPQWLERLRERT